MSRSLAFLISGSLLLFVGAISDTSPNTQLATGASEQYCFTRPDKSLSVQDVPLLVTVIYSGVTLSTTAAAHTMCEVGPTPASNATDHEGDLSANLPTPTSIALDGSGSSSNVILTDSRMPSPTSGDLAAGLNASSGAFGVPSTGRDTQVTSATMTSLATDLGTVSSRGTNSATMTSLATDLGTVASTGTGENTSVDNTSTSSRTVSSQLPVVTETGQNVVSSTGDVVQSASDGSHSSALMNGSSVFSLSMSRSANPNIGESMQTNVPPAATASAGVPMSTSTSSLISIPPLSSLGVGTQNGTLELSPAAVEALRLAQFLKNLGAAALNTSSWPSGSVYTSLAGLLEEFSQAGLLSANCSNASANLIH
jgi:hypothetical protein